MKKRIIIDVVVVIVVIIIAYFVFQAAKPSTNSGNTQTSTSTAASPSSTNPGEAFSATSVTLGVGQNTKVGGLTLTFMQLAQDNRCPVDVQCFQAGAAVAKVMFTTPRFTEIRNLSSGAAPYQFGVYKVSITDVTPVRRSHQDIAANAYRFTFVITPQDLPAGSVSLRGTIQCLPNRNPDQVHTAQCAFGFEDGKGRYFALQGSSQAQRDAIGTDYQHTVLVQGTFTPGESTSYSTIGTIRLRSIAVTK